MMTTRDRLDIGDDPTNFVPFSEDAVRVFPPHRTIHQGEWAGSACHYRAALYQTLVALRPKRCLEIGTCTGASACAFAGYFADCEPDGCLVTLDIARWVPIVLPRVETRLVRAFDPLLVQSLGEKFDFAFVDGHHTETDLLHDMLCAIEATKPPHFLLLDDTRDEIHESARVYRERIATDDRFGCFDYLNWWQKGCFVGASLVWVKHDVEPT